MTYHFDLSSDFLFCFVLVSDLNFMSSSEEEMEDMESAMAAGFIPADFAHVSYISRIE